MDDFISSRLCRICLEDGASFPIFEKTEIGSNIQKKLSLCLQNENIEDVDGFPRHICSTCNNTLETLCIFINKYRESSKILENGLKLVKKENNFSDAIDINILPDVEIKKIKEESDDDFNDGFDDLDDEKPLNILKKIKNDLIKKEKRSRKPKKPAGAKTNRIASSILEGNFLWSGEKWCMKIGETTFKKLRNSIEPKPRPQTKVVLPHVNRQPEQKLCDLCGDIFKNQEKLNTHKKTFHFKNPVKCPKCPRICVSDYYLKRHIKRKHELTKDFICSTCGQGFAYKGEMTNHVRNVHNKHLKPKKVFSCQFCDKSYKCQKSILIHERSVHTGQRPANCSICGSSFYHEDYLKEHMRLHTGETPFKCPICGRGYAQRGNMKSHLRIHRISELDAVTLSKMRPNYLKLLKV